MWTGFRVGHATYANTFLLPVVLVRRMLKRVEIGGGADAKPLPAFLAWIDPIFRDILAIEAMINSSRVALPFGLSAICNRLTLRA